MAVKKFIVGNFDDEAVLFPAVKKVRRAGYKLHDVFTPFPIHGLDHADITRGEFVASGSIRSIS